MIMAERILFVDDDPNILSSYKRQLRKRFSIETALSGEQGLEMLDNLGPFPVVVTDMRMPGMDGIQFLTKVKERSPDSVHILITGDADLQTAISATNEGDVFRFLTKPSSPEIFAKSLNAGLRQYQFIITERELLNKTLIGSVKALTKVLRMVNPMILSRTPYITRYARIISARMQLPDSWQIDLASMLSQIGCAFLPARIFEKVYTGQGLSPDEQKIYSSHLSIGADLVANIPRLEIVARMIKQQQKLFKDYNPSVEMTQGDMGDMGAQILKIAIDFDQMLASGHEYEAAMDELRNHPDDYNPHIVALLESLQTFRVSSSKMDDSEVMDEDREMEETDEDIKEIRPVNLRISMTAEEDIRVKDGTLLLSRGQQVSPLMQYVVERLHKVFRGKGDKIEEADQTDKSLPSGQYPDQDEGKKPDEDAGTSDTRPDMIVDRDIKTNDGVLLLAKGQKTTPLMQDILENAKEFLQTTDYKTAYVDEDGKIRPLSEENDGVPSSAELQKKPRSIVMQNIMSRLYDILQKRDYHIDDLETQIRQVEVSDLKVGMVTREDIWTSDGILLLSKEITDVSLKHLYSFFLTSGLKGSSFSILEKADDT